MTLPLVEFPEIVQHYAPFFASTFSEEAFVEFKRYISGLIVSENKTVDGINRIFVYETRNQSSLNRLLVESPFSVKALNLDRLGLMNSKAETQFKSKGVLSVDDTLLIHYGKHFEHIASLYDPSQQCYVWAHNLVNLHYSDDQTDYPVYFQLWEPADLDVIEKGLRDAGVTIKQSKVPLKEEALHKWRNYLLGLWRRNQHKGAVAQLYKSKLLIAQELLQEWVSNYPTLKLPVTFDNWYTQPAFCRFIDQTLRLPYVGTLSSDDHVILSSGTKTLGEFAQQLKEEHLAAVTSSQKPVFDKITISYKKQEETYYSYCNTHRIHNFGKQRLVINYTQDNPVFYISNRLSWQATGITRIRRHRWPVEVYHEEGKEQGLDQYQLRDFTAIYRHIALIAVVYSLLRAAQHDKVLLNKLQRDLKIELGRSLPSWQRAVKAHILWSLALFISSGLAQNLSLHDIMTPLIAAVYH